MGEMYTEAGVKKQKSAKDTLIKIAIFVADAILLFAGLLGFSIFLFLGIAAIVATFYFLPYLSIFSATGSLILIRLWAETSARPS